MTNFLIVPVSDLEKVAKNEAKIVTENMYQG